MFGLEYTLPAHDVVVIGASAGGLKALMTLIHALPVTIPASLFVVLHIPAHSPTSLRSSAMQGRLWQSTHKMASRWSMDRSIESALRHVAIDYILPDAKIASQLQLLVKNKINIGKKSDSETLKG